MKKSAGKISVLLATILAVSTLSGITAQAKTVIEVDTKIQNSVYANGVYINWEGVSTVSQFLDEKGNYCFAYKKGKKVAIVKTKRGKVKEKLSVKLKYPIFGAVTCDSEGFLYVVSGRKNKGNKKKDTVFVTKYTNGGVEIKTVGDNGSFGLADYYDDGFYTSEPFRGGNCDIAVNGNFVAVNYARGMYNGHQSNTALILNTTTMEKQKLSAYYNSHSFGQRAIPYRNGFMLASEGDAYDRAFNVAFTNMSEDPNPAPEEEKTPEDEFWGRWYQNLYEEDPADTAAYQEDQYAMQYYTKKKERKVKDYNIFHFWMKKNNSSNMYCVNNNYAHLGGIAVADTNRAALVGTSVKAMNKKADKQKESLFIQIFDPTMDLSKPEAFISASTRSGKTGIGGTEDATDYGIKWLTNGKYDVQNPQVVADSKGRFVVLFEKKEGGICKGVFYTIIDRDGKTVKKVRPFSAGARLNSCETPMVVGNEIMWTANKPGSSSMIVFRLKV